MNKKEIMLNAIEERITKINNALKDAKMDKEISAFQHLELSIKLTELMIQYVSLM